MAADFEVVPMADRHNAAYRRMLDSCAALPIQSGLEHRDFLRRLLPDAADRYLVATAGGEVLGALPAFVARPPGFPAILNALPFFGGHGGPYVASRIADPRRVQAALLEGFLRLAESEDVAAATLVSNPMDADVAWFSQVLGSASQDRRIGQISTLPQCPGEPERAGDLLMAGFHQKTRNAVRKGLKREYRFRKGGSESDFAALRALHTANMTAIGAPAKSAAAFSALREAFPIGTGSQLYLAEAAGEIVAGLLVLLSGGLVEYFTPAVSELHRSGQPLSALIFIAMRDAVLEGRRVWNWGGTHPALGDLHRFKRRWGAEDRPYHYFTIVRSADLLDMSPRRLQEAYPSFYVVPYAMLRSGDE